MVLERFHKNKKGRVEELIQRATLLFTNLPEGRERDAFSPAWIDVDHKILGLLSDVDRAHLDLDSGQQLRIYACADGRSTWVAIRCGNKRVRYCENDYRLKVFHEERIGKDQWAPLGANNIVDDWGVFEKIVELGESLLRR